VSNALVLRTHFGQDLKNQCGVDSREVMVHHILAQNAPCGGNALLVREGDGDNCSLCVNVGYFFHRRSAPVVHSSSDIVAATVGGGGF